MKIQHMVLISVLLSGSGVALAAGGGTGGGAEGVPGDNSAMKAASGSMSSKTHSTKMKKKHTHTAAKPVNDTTHTPGADASSDTKGH